MEQNDIASFSKVTTAAANGLNLQETEALVGHKLDEAEKTTFNKTKAVIKLQKATEDKQSAKKNMQVGIAQNLKPKLPPVHERYTKEQVAEVIEQQYGVVTSICNFLDCTYSQFYKAVKQYGLQQTLSQAKKNLCSMAEQVIVTALQSSDEKTRIDAAKYTLSRLGKDLGWGDTPFAAMQVEISPGEKQNQIKAIFGIKQDGAGDNNT